jgi:hypothetical protein
MSRQNWDHPDHPSPGRTEEHWTAQEVHEHPREIQGITYTGPPVMPEPHPALVLVTADHDPDPDPQPVTVGHGDTAQSLHNFHPAAPPHKLSGSKIQGVNYARHHEEQ